MAGGMHGFVAQGEKPSMDPAEVGERLARKAESGAPTSEQPESPVDPPRTAGHIHDGGELGPSLEDREQMTRVGAALMGGGMGMPEPGLQEHSDSATTMAIGEMMSRLGSGGNPNRVNIMKSPENARLLKKHGLSEIEVELLSRSGVI